VDVLVVVDGAIVCVEWSIGEVFEELAITQLTIFTYKAAGTRTFYVGIIKTSKGITRPPRSYGLAPTAAVEQ
jgi:hypothetical protein